MKHNDFEKIISRPRLDRYLLACKGDTKKAMTLYRLNLRLTQEMFTLISCFEIALRNSIDKICSAEFGSNWLKESIKPNGIFNSSKCKYSQKTINYILKNNPNKSNHKIISELGFGFWRYMFAQNQFNATNRILLKIFPEKPISTAEKQYNNKYIFNKLASLNQLRNRMAHHEPICFIDNSTIKSTFYTRLKYKLIIQLLIWMEIEANSFFYGLDHINSICNKIDTL